MRDQLLDTSIDSAKRKVSTYAKAQNQLKSVLDIGDRLKAEYNITDAEFVALTQEGDIGKTYEAIVNEAANRRNLFGESGFNRTTFKNEFMLFVYNVKDEYKEIIPAVTHVDGSARVQTVSADDNQKLYSLLLEFKQQTGHSVLINTSYNIKGEPIVCSPKEALHSFINADIDILVMGNYVARK